MNYGSDNSMMGGFRQETLLVLVKGFQEMGSLGTLSGLYSHFEVGVVGEGWDVSRSQN